MTIVHYDADCEMAAEALDIERGVRPYLSMNGPRWDLQRVHVDEGREVLLVLVDPPKAGQPAFPCFKDGPGLNNGQIIVRGDGETTTGDRGGKAPAPAAARNAGVGAAKSDLVLPHTGCLDDEVARAPVHQSPRSLGTGSLEVEA